jgi:hypothetical protein
LPYVESLSLKNCWLSPDILWKFLALKENSENSFQSLKFDSVSLSVPIPLTANVGPGNPAANNGVATVNVGVVHQAQAQHPAAQNQHPHALPPLIPVNFPRATEELEWLHVRFGSWSHIVNAFTPGKSVADAQYEHKVGPKPSSSLPKKLKKMEFRSCGYVRLNLNFDQVMLEAPDPPLPHAIKRTSFDDVMMSNNDNSLATIINHISATEIKTLENVWNMETSWGQSRDELFLDAKRDGIEHPGRGRFDGVIEAPKEDQIPTRTIT